jgi:hypothetical protein
MNDMREEIELPPLSHRYRGECTWDRCDPLGQREDQLKAAIRDLLIAKEGADRAVEIGLELAKRESAANLRAENAEAANREKDAEIARLKEMLQVASDEHDHTRILRGWPVLNNIGRWEIELDMKKYRESYVAPPSTEKES